MRERLPREFPGTEFAFLPVDIVSQILQLRPAGADRRADRRRRARMNRDISEEMLESCVMCRACVDLRIQQTLQLSPSCG